MSKILLPTIDYPPARGGVARYVGAIQTTYPDQVKILKLKPKQKLLDLVFKLLWSSRGTEVIWTHHVLPLGTAAMIVKKLTKKPYVVFLHGLDFDLARRDQWKRALTKVILNSADRIVTNSEALAAEVRDFTKSDRTPIVVYPTLEDVFIATAQEPGVKQKVNLKKLGELALGIARSSTPIMVSNNKETDHPLTLLTVARLVERKGHLQVLEALEQLPNVHYHIVGDGPMLQAITDEISKRGLEDRVQITRDAGDEQLPDIYRNADIFVMPTVKSNLDREGFGIVYIEAQLFGLPVIATRHPGVDEAVRDGEGGLLINGSTDELVAAVNRLKDPAIRSKFGARGKQWVIREFNREQQMYKLRELL